MAKDAFSSAVSSDAEAPIDSHHIFDDHTIDTKIQSVREGSSSKSHIVCQEDSKDPLVSGCSCSALCPESAVSRNSIDLVCLATAVAREEEMDRHRPCLH